MSTEEIVAKFESLSEDDQKLVMDFVDFHLARLDQSGSLPKQGGVPGLAKGRITTADDFDAPLDDFKE
jgi:hypothetical protein